MPWSWFYHTFYILFIFLSVVVPYFPLPLNFPLLSISHSTISVSFLRKLVMSSFTVVIASPPSPIFPTLPLLIRSTTSEAERWDDKKKDKESAKNPLLGSPPRSPRMLKERLGTRLTPTRFCSTIWPKSRRLSAA